MPGARCFGLILLLVAMLAGGELRAGEFTGFYGGADFGPIQAEACNDDYCIDSTELGYRLVLGYRFNRNLGLELDRTESRNHDFPGAASGNRGELRQMGLRLVGTLDLGMEYSLLGAIGVNHWEARETDRGGGTRLTLDGTDPTVALGFQRQLSDTMVMRGYVEYTEADLGSVMLGFRARLF